jgi:hypothetical protein
VCVSLFLFAVPAPHHKADYAAGKAAVVPFNYSSFIQMALQPLSLIAGTSGGRWICWRRITLVRSTNPFSPHPFTSNMSLSSLCTSKWIAIYE